MITATEPENALSKKTEEVKNWFDATEIYLNRRRFDIQLRAETIQALTEGRKIERILDIGCGDGSISAPLLNASRRLTLLDLSNNMLSLARSKVSADLQARVEAVNLPFMSAPLEAQSYDLVLCIGVLAHVDSPADVMAKIATLLKPGGTLILEFTDSIHFAGRIYLPYHVIWTRIKGSVGKGVGYELNCLCYKDIKAMYEKEGFRLSAMFRYSMPPPGSHRVFSQQTLYKLTRLMFGNLGRNRNSWMGNEYILRLENQ